MDLTALQATLRQFAAERDWQPVHTPKNLAMALLVEAAELLEIFQWLTPEQSLAVRGDAVLQSQIGDEVADVLLYLLQLADHSGVDLKRAVGKKLLKNAKKHPPLHPGQPAGSSAAAATETHVLVDWENVQPNEETVRRLVPDVTDLWLFHGPTQQKVGAHHGAFGDRLKLVKIARSGKNALDFHLSFYMGYIASRHPAARFVVLSNDRGYGPMLEHATTLGFGASQLEVPRLGGPVAGSPASTTSPLKKAAAKKASPKQATAKKTATTPAPPPPNASAAKQPAAPAAKAKPKVAPVRTPASAKKAKPAAPTPAKIQPATRVEALPAASCAAAASITDAAQGFDLPSAAQQVLANLRKTAAKPARQARLLASIKSWLGSETSDQAAHGVLMHLLASGQVHIDDKGAVLYAP